MLSEGPDEDTFFLVNMAQQVAHCPFPHDSLKAMSREGWREPVKQHSFIEGNTRVAVRPRWRSG